MSKYWYWHWYLRLKYWYLYWYLMSKYRYWYLTSGVLAATLAVMRVDIRLRPRSGGSV